MVVESLAKNNLLVKEQQHLDSAEQWLNTDALMLTKVALGPVLDSVRWFGRPIVELRRWPNEDPADELSRCRADSM